MGKSPADAPASPLTQAGIPRDQFLSIYEE
jgi:hypothetical protein